MPTASSELALSSCGWMPKYTRRISVNYQLRGGTGVSLRHTLLSTNRPYFYKYRSCSGCFFESSTSLIPSSSRFLARRLLKSLPSARQPTMSITTMSVSRDTYKIAKRSATSCQKPPQLETMLSTSTGSCSHCKQSDLMFQTKRAKRGALFQTSFPKNVNKVEGRRLL
jgi:hypothetical protein